MPNQVPGARYAEIQKVIEILRTSGQAIGISLDAVRHLQQELNALCRSQERECQLRREIAHCRRVEQALRESEDVLRAFFDGSGVRMVILELDGDDFRYVRSNREVADSYGLTVEQMAGKTAKELNLPDDLIKERVAALRRCHAAQQSITVEYSQPCQGRLCWYYATISPIPPGPSGRLRFAVAALDITRRKQDEEDLRGVQRRLADIIDFLPDATFALDAEGKVIAWNKATEKLTGVNKEEILGRGDRAHALAFYAQRRPMLIDLILDDDPENRRFFEYVTESGQTLYAEAYDSHLHDGQGALLWGIAAPLLDGEGRVIGAIESVRDITDRKRAEEELWESRQRLRIVLDSIPVRVFWKDRRSVYLGCNRPFAHDAGRESIEEVIGKTDNELGFPEAERFRADDRQVMESGQSKINYEEPQTTPGESPRWVRTSKIPLRDPEGHIIGVLGTYEDITERKRIEQERIELLHREQKARADAEAANAKKDQFLAVLSHELRTPLTPVLARLELIKRQQAVPPGIGSALEMIRRNVELEVRLIDDLLDLSKVAHGKLQLNLQVMDAYQAIESAVSIHHHEIEAKKIQVTLDWGARRHYVRGDPVRLSQVFWNLVGNAIKFTPVEGRIRISTANEGDLLKVEVTDSGIGIDPQMMPRLFSAFEQGEPILTRRYGGLGLGLSITKAIVCLHGGTIAARSEGRDKGAVFTVRLQTVERVAPTAPPRPEGKPKRSLKILLVEDNEDTRRMLARLLKAIGHEVKTAGSAKATLELAAAEPFDLLISDIGLPDQTGWALMQDLQRVRPMPGVALSGFAQEEDIRRSKAAGFVAHLTKPIDVQKLEQTILAASAT